LLADCSLFLTFGWIIAFQVFCRSSNESLMRISLARLTKVIFTALHGKADVV